MEVVIAVVIALTLGIIVGLIVSMIRLHIHSSGTLIFDRSDETTAPYICFESYDDLIAIRKKKYVTLTVGWTKESTRK